MLRTIFIAIFTILTIKGIALSYIPVLSDTVPDTISKVKIDTVKIEKVVYVYDTVRVYDTIFHYDTIIVPEILKNAIEVSFLSGVPLPKITSLNTETYEITQKIKESEYGKMSFGFGVAYKHKAGKWSWQIGLGLLNFNQTANYDFIKTTVNSRTHIDSIDNSYWQVSVIDTFYEVTGIDTIPIVVTDSTYIPVFTTDTITTHDTLRKTEKYSGKNKYLYLRIPVILRYKLWNNNKWILSAGSGFIVGILSNIRGKTLSENDDIQAIESFTPVRTNFILHADINLSYSIDKNINISIGLLEEYMLKPLFPEEKNIRRKFLFYSTKIGLEYFF